MKQLFSIFSLLFFSFAAFSQDYTEVVWSTTEDEVCFDMIETTDSYVLVGEVNHLVGGSSALLLQYEKDGDLLTQREYAATDSSMRWQWIKETATGFVAMGYKYPANTLRQTVVFFYLDENFDILYERELVLAEDNYSIYFSNVMLNSSGHFIVHGFSAIGNDYYYEGLYFFAELTPEGELLNTNHFSVPAHLHVGYALIEKNDNTGYYFFPEPSTGCIELSTNLEFQKYTPILHYHPLVVHMFGLRSPFFLSDSTYMIAAEVEQNIVWKSAVALCKMDTAHNMLDDIIFDIEYSEDRLGRFNAVSLTSENDIYFGSSKHFSPFHPYSTQPGCLILRKMDMDWDIEWEFFYSDDKYYYYIVDMITTSNDDCLLVCARSDPSIAPQDNQRDILLLKVDSEGNTAGFDDMPEARQAIVYPNPGSRELRVRVAVQLGQCHMLLYDMQGRQVLNAEIASGENTLNTAQLPAGTYIYHIQSGNESVESGQWTKTR